MTDDVKVQADITTRSEFCPAGWGPGGCDYTGGHYCDRAAGHKGRHRCVCGATSRVRIPTDEDQTDG